MATNKTINVTNVTVQIPAMTDKPNQSVNSNCTDKIIDGLNALNSNLNNLFKYPQVGLQVIDSGTLAAGSSGYFGATFTVPPGYITTGIIAINMGHPADARGLNITGAASRGLEGQQTTYFSYYTPRDIDASKTDIIITFECINKNSVLT